MGRRSVIGIKRLLLLPRKLKLGLVLVLNIHGGVLFLGHIDLLVGRRSLNISCFLLSIFVLEVVFASMPTSSTKNLLLGFPHFVKFLVVVHAPRTMDRLEIEPSPKRSATSKATLRLQGCRETRGGAQAGEDYSNQHDISKRVLHCHGEKKMGVNDTQARRIESLLCSHAQ
jgi:hypothetical protein